MTICPCLAQAPGNSAIKISINGHYFTDENSKPFFWQGDTEWELFRSFSVSEAKGLLRERMKQGFNVIQVMVTGLYPEAGGQFKGLGNPNVKQAWINNNPLTPNEDYFKRTDSIIKVAEEYGMMLVVGVYHSGDNDAGRINTSSANAWARWLARRYKNTKNIIWCMYPHADPSSYGVIRATVQGILAGDGGTHLITMHPDPSPTSSSLMHTEFWLSFNTLQTWSTDLFNYDMVRSDYARLPVKPVVNGEARYEAENGITPFETRRAGYWSYLAGGFYSYGHTNNYRLPLDWRSWCNTAGANQMVIMGKLFKSIEWWKLIPDQSIFEKWINGNTVARSNDGDWILAYLTNKDSAILNLNKITASKTATGWWIDPLTGNRIKIGTFTTSGNQAFILPTGWEDGVLLLEQSPR